MAPSVKKRGRKLPPGPGRPKGCPNKNTAILKDAILLAATQAGGKAGLVGYLASQAKKHPGPFLTLLGKILPMQHTGAIGTYDLTHASDADISALESILTRIANISAGEGREGAT